jgi:hypothetical protein
MKRVVILGRGASGKSTLAVRLGEITGLPVIELDKMFWRPGLVATPRDQWVVVQQRLVAEEKWIMDGDLGPYDAVEIRLRAADTILFFDFSLGPLRLASNPANPGRCGLLALGVSLRAWRAHHGLDKTGLWLGRRKLSATSGMLFALAGSGKTWSRLDDRVRRYPGTVTQLPGLCGFSGILTNI